MDVRASEENVPAEANLSEATNSSLPTHIKDDSGHGIEEKSLSSSSYSDLSEDEKMLILKTVDVCMERGPSWLETLREQKKEELKFLEEGNRGHIYFMKMLFSRLKKGWGEAFA